MSATRAVRTVLGDVAPGELGRCDAHDHLFFRSEALPGQEQDDAVAAAAELDAFATAGGRALIQWTPHGLGRGAAELPRLARESGVHLVAATGLHQVRHYRPGVVEALHAAARLAELFVAELTDGITDGITGGVTDGVTDGVTVGPGGPRVRAGMIKVAGAFHGVDAHAGWTMAAAAEAHHATGAPIGVHLEGGTGGPEVAALLCDRLGVPPDSVVLGHLNRAPDDRLLRELAATGCFLGFEGPSRAHHATDWRLFDTLAALVDAGSADRLLLGGDTVPASARAVHGEGPGAAFLPRMLWPRLAREFGADIAAAVTVANPARAFSAEWRAEHPQGRGELPGRADR